MRHSISTTLAITELFSASVWAATCYHSNGTSHTTDESKICAFNDLQGQCCGLSDICLKNGLCKTTGSVTSYWRDTCSNSNWTLAHCLQECTGHGGNSLMTPCDEKNKDYSRTWCCGTSKACCDTDSAITVDVNLFLESTSTTTSSTSATSTLALASTSTSTSTSPSTSLPDTSSTSSDTQSSASLSQGAKVGIGVGVAVAGVLIIIALLWLFLMRRSRKTKNLGSGARAASASSWAIRQPIPPQELGANDAHEVSASDRDTVHELPGEMEVRR
ncbi:hypothetical protein P170DRAFT_433589 [Aspergillus steynii IBT 23096]|uniref:Mid2 domain-containing protein n=1 Tax=Aspergillus steynii IBT 23096 TaxID=1392250 RepID=A0A2I2GFS9_9EURO|nr:uncharacterized protein P170DRAFT_433589 [Aspergillus steynii IBT 23096]PLB51721.1 hypothetical protein P170DRAFT_433589 [Aspergillus steynii IBT 23096]